MTGYAVGRCVTDGDLLSLEAKSVNGKHLKASVKLPHALAPYEPLVLELIRERITRGNVRLGCLEFTGFTPEEARPRVDQARARGYLAALEELPPGVARSLSAYELLRLPGVLAESGNGVDAERLEAAVRRAAEQALDGLLERRREEGDRLGEAMERILAELRDLRGELHAAVADASAQLADNLRQRLNELLDDDNKLDEGRLEQEVAYLATRADVTEELDRLDSHLEAFDAALAEGGAVGRRLDFLCQEIHRELTTCGNKAVGTAITPVVLEMKVLLDQLREQAANLA